MQGCDIAGATIPVCCIVTVRTVLSSIAGCTVARRAAAKESSGRSERTATSPYHSPARYSTQLITSPPATGHCLRLPFFHNKPLFTLLSARSAYCVLLLQFLLLTTRLLCFQVKLMYRQCTLCFYSKPKKLFRRHYLQSLTAKFVANAEFYLNILPEHISVYFSFPYLFYFILNKQGQFGNSEVFGGTQGRLLLIMKNKKDSSLFGV